MSTISLPVNRRPVAGASVGCVRITSCGSLEGSAIRAIRCHFINRSGRLAIDKAANHLERHLVRPAAVVADVDDQPLQVGGVLDEPRKGLAHLRPHLVGLKIAEAAIKVARHVRDRRIEVGVVQEFPALRQADLPRRTVRCFDGDRDGALARAGQHAEIRQAMVACGVEPVFSARQ